MFAESCSLICSVAIAFEFSGFSGSKQVHDGQSPRCWRFPAGPERQSGRTPARHRKPDTRLYTAEGLKTLLRLLRSAKSESVKLRAAEIILERGWGKAIQAVQVDGRFLEKKLHEMSDAKLAAFEERLMASAAEQQANSSGTLN
jgi:hypothetical protein